MLILSLYLNVALIKLLLRVLLVLVELVECLINLLLLYTDRGKEEQFEHLETVLVIFVSEVDLNLIDDASKNGKIFCLDHIIVFLNDSKNLAEMVESSLRLLFLQLLQLLRLLIESTFNSLRQANGLLTSRSLVKVDLLLLLAPLSAVLRGNSHY